MCCYCRRTYVKWRVRDSIAQLLSQKKPTPIEMVGVNDSFGESGPPRDLMQKYGLTFSEIVSAAKKVITRKTS